MADVLRRSIKGASDGSNPLLLSLAKEAAGAERPPSKAPNMFAVAAAAAKFKRGNAANSQVSKEKRELLKKVESDKKWKACSQRIFSDLQELVKPHLAADVPSNNEDRSESGSSDAGCDNGGQAAVLSGIQSILKEFCAESMSICCDSWEVDKLAKRLKTSTDHLAANEKSNRDAHSKFMMELSSVKAQLMRAQNMKESDVKITGSDVIFYEATEYLEEDQRQLVKEVIEYKLRQELARGICEDDLGNTNMVLKKTIKDLELKAAELQEKLRDEKETVKNLRREFDERNKADSNKNMKRPASPVAEVKPTTRVRELRKPTKDDAIQTERIQVETIIQAAPPKETITRDAANDPIPRVTADFSQQISLLKEAVGEKTVYKEAAKPEGKSASTQTDPQAATVDSSKLDEVKSAAAAAAKEAERLHNESMRAAEQLKEDLRSLQRELDRAKQALKAAQAAGGPVTIVEVEKEGVTKPTEMKEVQTDGKIALSEHSEEEQSDLLGIQEARIRELEEAALQKDLQIKLLTTEAKVLKTQLADMKEELENQPPRTIVQGDNKEELEKAMAETQNLRAKNQQLADDLQQAHEKNTKLDVSINELMDKLRTLQEQLRNAGMGHIADRMFDSAGLADILSNKPMTVFDRLYNDALKRVRKDRGYKAMKTEAAQAFMQTVDHIDNGDHQVSPTLQQRGGSPSQGQRPGGFDPNPQSSMSQGHHQQFQQNHQQQAQQGRRSSLDDSQGHAVVDHFPETAPNEEVEIKMGSRVRATEGMQFKIGARTVTVPKGSIGTIVQLFPGPGVDWDCLPSVDKVMMQKDMIEAVDMRRPTPPRISVDSGSQQQSQMPPHNASQSPQSQTSMNIRLPQMSASSSAADFCPSQGNRPHMSPQGMSMTKSLSTPSFMADPSAAMHKKLPRLGSPGQMMRQTTGGSGFIAGRSSPGHETVSFVAGAGARPSSSSMSLTVGMLDPRRGPAGGGHSVSPSKQHAGSVGAASLRSRSRSQPPPKQGLGLVVSGQMCDTH